MKKQYYFSVLSFLCIIFGLFHFSACEETFEEVTFIENSSDYFPNKIGTWAEYQVDSTIYSVFVEGGRKEVSIQLREELTEEFTDNEGRTAVLVRRFFRYDKTKNWNEINPTVWYQVKDEKQAERMEGEKRFVKMVFPISTHRTWEGNTYLNTENAGKGWLNEYELGAYDGWEYRYQNIENPQTLGNLTFDNTVTILQEDYEDKINRRYGLESYAKDVGLIYKEEWILNADDTFMDDPWPDHADRGHVIKMQITDYGTL